MEIVWLLYIKEFKCKMHSMIDTCGTCFGQMSQLKNILLDSYFSLTQFGHSPTHLVCICVCGGVCASHFINCVVWINLRAIWYLIFWKISCIAVFLLCACGGVSGLMLAFHYNELV